MTPQQQFLETAHAAEHRKTVETPAFQEALNYAMLEYASRLAAQSEVAGSASKLAGAHDFRMILITLATNDDVPQGTKPPSLRHDAYDAPSRTG